VLSRSCTHPQIQVGGEGTLTVQLHTNSSPSVVLFFSCIAVYCFKFFLSALGASPLRTSYCRPFSAIVFSSIHRIHRAHTNTKHNERERERKGERCIFWRSWVSFLLTASLVDVRGARTRTGSHRTLSRSYAVSDPKTSAQRCCGWGPPLAARPPPCASTRPSPPRSCRPIAGQTAVRHTAPTAYGCAAGALRQRGSSAGAKR